MSAIVVRGARQHNLADVDVDIPRDRLVVITGPSGSGKSSLAFDTIYAEGQRRYVESLSVYARQFLDQLPRPDVDLIDGLSPAIAVSQGSPNRNPRSTVGTVTEIYDHLRLLYARGGEVHCPRCDRVIRAHTREEMVDEVLALGEGTRVQITAPLEAPDAARIEELKRAGFVRVLLDGVAHDLAEDPAIEGAMEVEVSIDRLVAREASRSRLAESIELAASVSAGRVTVRGADGSVALALSEHYACPDHGPVMAELTPRTFSYNRQEGACPVCAGVGEERTFDPDRIVPDDTRSIAEGAIAPWGKPGGAYHRAMVAKLEASTRIKPETAWKRLSKKQRATILEGDDAFVGVIPALEQRARDYEAKKRAEGRADEAIEYLEEELGRYTHATTCSACGGSRLRREALAVRVSGRRIDELTTEPVDALASFFDALTLSGRAKVVLDRVVREIRSRLRFLTDVGLGYLTLSRRASTLSGGETQRIRLGTQLGSALVGVLYVLDEPSIGLHPRDNERLLATLGRLRDAGNTVLVVEHDLATVRAADRVIDMGPGAGRLGGHIVAEGTARELEQSPASVTGPYLREGVGRVREDEPREARGAIVVRGVSTHNLKDVSTRFPIGCLTCVTGVSGSGKSSLVIDSLLPLVLAALDGRAAPGAGELVDLGDVDKVLAIDQAPIGRSPRSNPATYCGLFGPLRELFASLPEARTRGYGASRFSFNVKGGRCESCAGEGVLRVSMHFLPDVFVTCTTCQGRRYNRETLEVKYRGLSVADVLDQTVDEALEIFGVVPQLGERLRALVAVGLGYVTLGQPATTLSGGEAQRLKLAKELAKKATGSTLYVLDEPTTGLHPSDVDVLLRALDALTDLGNTVVVIEHDPQVIGVADHVIDLGPEGGDAGGHVVFEGSPSALVACEASITARYLA